jgi:menaquinone-9 beta-reductase
VEPLECEVLVIGSRIAGSTLAALLAEAHRDVVLADRARFPSPTLSTHFFRGAGGVAVLRRLGVLEEVLALGAPELACQYDYLDGEESFRLGPPQDPGEAGFCLSVRREPLDDILLRRAGREPAVRVLQGTRLVELTHGDRRVVGAVLARGREMIKVRSRFIIGADGRHSRVATAAGAGFERSDKPARALYYQYVRGFPSPGPGPGPEFSFRGDQIAYVFPSDDGVTCVAVSVNLAAFQQIRRSLASAFPRVIAAHGGLAGRFSQAEPVSRVLGCGPEPSYVRQPFGAGWALVGDASIHQDPWTGVGIDFASTHATFLAEALLEVIDGHRPEAKSLADYRTRRNEHGMAIYEETTELAKDLRTTPSE